MFVSRYSIVLWASARARSTRINRKWVLVVHAFCYEQQQPVGEYCGFGFSAKKVHLNQTVVQKLCDFSYSILQLVVFCVGFFLFVFSLFQCIVCCKREVSWFSNLPHFICVVWKNIVVIWFDAKKELRWNRKWNWKQNGHKTDFVRLHRIFGSINVCFFYCCWEGANICISTVWHANFVRWFYLSICVWLERMISAFSIFFNVSPQNGRIYRVFDRFFSQYNKNIHNNYNNNNIKNIQFKVRVLKDINIIWDA